ncbi:MAG TPA: hypothetical protein DCE41_26170 [Cytophagales bacterium]|nr:hypothetical protein [Cytophagales bacterium]HAA22429.1 hypothetical protein [Cytophagales bacterium]HAP62308.1 hypothetical protein [Cytophagales bacterium]
MADFDGTIKSTPETRADELANLGAGSSTPATKMFAVSATGNLFVASTLNGGPDSDPDLTDSAKTAFGQVSIFFAAMTKSIASTKNPKTGEFYSIYDYDALDAVIRRSGMFIQVGQNNYSFESDNWGMTLSSELVGVLMAGFTGDMVSIGRSLMPLVSSFGTEGFNLSGKSSSEVSTIGALVFVCEYLLGAVSITPILVYANLEDNKAAFKAGPCFNAEAGSFTYKLAKRQYLFVPPEFTDEALTINEAMDNEEFKRLVDKLTASLRESNTDTEPSED